LSGAAYNVHFEIVKYLVEKGVNIYKGVSNLLKMKKNIIKIIIHFTG
jgi:transcription initiation factor IIE alpha subunit